MTRPWMVLLLCLAACSERVDSAPRAGDQNLESPMPMLAAEDIEAYRAGVSREIALRSQAEGLGFTVREEVVDSAAAEAAGIPVPRYRLLAEAIEALLARGPKSGLDPEAQLSRDAASVWSQDRFHLDSLRLEVLVLRTRTGS